MSTPRVDDVAFKVGQSMVGTEVVYAFHARALETELARCREALAREYLWCANRAEKVHDDRRAQAYRRYAAALRDLSKPTPEELP